MHCILHKCVLCLRFVAVLGLLCLRFIGISEVVHSGASKGYVAYVMYKQKQQYFGVMATAEEAARVRDTARIVMVS